MIKQTTIIMGMPITILLADVHAHKTHMTKLFQCLRSVDRRFSPFHMDSELSKINTGEILLDKASRDMKEVLDLCEQTKQETNGYFNILHNEMRDPSGMVKGWAIDRAISLAKEMGCPNLFIDMGNDIYAHGYDETGNPWKFGLKNPSQQYDDIETLRLSDRGVSTSSSYIRGQHIYDPFTGREPDGIISITVIAPSALDADRFSTAAFAMGKKGIGFIEEQKEVEGYMLDRDNKVTMTKGFKKYLA